MIRRAALVFATVLGLQAATVTSFDPGWRFLKSDAPGAEAPGFVDDTWRTVSVPHDWAIEGPFDEKNPARRRRRIPARRHRLVSQAISCCRDADANKRVFIDFDGVMANSDVWINGFHLGKRPYGYVSFRYELTGHLKFGANAGNVLAVRADDSAAARIALVSRRGHLPPRAPRRSPAPSTSTTGPRSSPLPKPRPAALPCTSKAAS